MFLTKSLIIAKGWLFHQVKESRDNPMEERMTAQLFSFLYV